MFFVSFLLHHFTLKIWFILQYKKLLKVVKYYHRVRKGHFHQRFQQILNIFDNCEGFLTKLYHEPKDGGERHEGCDRENQPLHGFEPWPFDEFTWAFWSWSCFGFSCLLLQSQVLDFFLKIQRFQENFEFKAPSWLRMTQTEYVSLQGKAQLRVNGKLS